MFETIKKLTENRKQILEGIANSIFINKKVEEIANHRLEICNACPHIDRTGEKCVVPKTNPCCGLCGCSLHLKSRSLSSSCDDGRWRAVLSEEEESNLNLNNDAGI